MFASSRPVAAGCDAVVSGARPKVLPMKPLKRGDNIDVRLRHSLRGLKRCPSCGQINGQRSLICRNLECELRKQTLLMRRAFDPVQLVTHTQADLYSVRSKERDMQPRNFVQITDVTLALEKSSAIVSRNAICYVDTCKYDASDATKLSCKHVKTCTDGKTPKAEVYTVAHEVLWNLNIELEQKMRLWDMYKEDEELVPAVQRLNASTFAVKCAKSQNFPAGRLHVQATPNQLSAKKGTHACACKKLKIIVEPDNSVVMQEEICDHLLLLLAAVLSKRDGKKIYGNFTNALKSFWMPHSLETPLVDASQEDALFGFSINIAGNGAMTGSSAADDIFIFDNEFLPNDQDIPDFPENILKSVVNLPETNVASGSIFSDENGGSSDSIYHAGDPNLVSSCGLIEDTDIQFDDITSATTIATVDSITNDCSISDTHLELTDCNIELMDQFQQLTDQIDLCSEDLALPHDSNDLFQADSMSIMPHGDFSEVGQEQINHHSINNNNNNNNIVSSSDLSTLNFDVRPVCQLQTTEMTQSSVFNTNSLLKANNNNIQVGVQYQQVQQTPSLPLIELPTIAVVKKEPIKSVTMVTDLKPRKFEQIPVKQAMVVNDLDKIKKAHIANVEAGPALGYSAWLEYVIEIMNNSIDMESDVEVKHSFHVHEEIFSHFSKCFSVGVKRRMPNSSCMMKSGKYKGLIKYTWFFNTASTVQRIFSTRNLTLQVERTFEKSHDGYRPYVKRPPDETADKYRRIFPKLALHVAHIWFDCSNNNHKTGLKIEWLPNAFPKSHHGILNIEFSLGFRVPSNP